MSPASSAFRETLLVVIALLSAFPFPFTAFFALYMAGGADSGWRGEPSAEAMRVVAVIVLAPLLQLVLTLLALIMRKRWSYSVRLVLAATPLVYLLMIPVLLGVVEGA